MLSYDKELVKAKNHNINVLYLNLLLFAFLSMEFIFLYENLNVTAIEASPHYHRRLHGIFVL